MSIGLTLRRRFALLSSAWHWPSHTFPRGNEAPSPNPEGPAQKSPVASPPLILHTFRPDFLIAQVETREDVGRLLGPRKGQCRAPPFRACYSDRRHDGYPPQEDDGPSRQPSATVVAPRGLQGVRLATGAPRGGFHPSPAETQPQQLATGCGETSYPSTFRASAESALSQLWGSSWIPTASQGSLERPLGAFRLVTSPFL